MEGTTSGPRRCSCGRRLSTMNFDPHSVCLQCRGSACDFTNRCGQCKSWSNAEMEKYLEHQASLARKHSIKLKQQATAYDNENPNSDQTESTSGETVLSEHEGESDQSMQMNKVREESIGLQKGQSEPGDRCMASVMISEDQWASMLAKMTALVEQNLTRKLEDRNQIRPPSLGYPSPLVTGKSGPFKTSKKGVGYPPVEEPPAKRMRYGTDPGVVSSVDGSSHKAQANLPTQAKVTQATLCASRSRPPPGSKSSVEGLDYNLIDDDYNEEEEEEVEEEEEEFMGDQFGVHDDNQIPNDGDLGGVSGDEVKSFPEDKMFNLVMETIGELFPESKVPEVERPVRACLYEGWFRELKKQQGSSRLGLYGRISDIRSDLEGMVSRLMGTKKPVSLIPTRRRTFRVGGDESFDGPPEVNEEIVGILGSKVVNDQVISLSMEELKRLESHMLSVQENQSLSLWVISLMMALLHQGYSGPHVGLLEGISSIISASMVNQNTLVSQVSAYLVAKHREALLDWFPSFSDVHKKSLKKTSPFSTSLFDKATLRGALDECEKHASWRASLVGNSQALRQNWKVRENPGSSRQVSSLQARSGNRYQPGLSSPSSCRGVLATPSNQSPRGRGFSVRRGRMRPGGRMNRTKSRKDFA